ncbi:hypothetical protein PG991_012212 [Apiospora marii]|uniref:UbiA prenyltransferase n=1 Tax=Apiospora marii TaxID=335849 RepID=A0ABR1R974_9PEZI
MHKQNPIQRAKCQGGIQQTESDGHVTTQQGQRTIWFHAKTTFLFTKGDFKSVVWPQSLFAYSVAVASGGREGLWSRVPLMLLWLWIHLLVEDISNQRLPKSILEDRVNKPWRPIPAGRLSPAEAQQALQAVVPLTMCLSTLLGSLAPSTALLSLIWLYNDLDVSSTGPLIRNSVNALGLGCFGWGAVSVLLGEQGVDGDSQQCWVLLTTLAVATTIHAQDLPDMAGDAMRGRRTVPLVHGESAARCSVSILVPVWTVVCLIFWDGGYWARWVAFPVSIVVSLVVMTQRGVQCGAMAWQLWCIWITTIYAIPLLAKVA